MRWKFMKASNKQAFWNWFLLTTFFAYQYLLRTYPGVFTDNIRETFHCSAKTFATFTTSCIVIYSCLQIPLGILLDRIGLRKIILFSLGVCWFGQWIFAHTNSVFWAQFGRVLTGIGAAPAFMSAVKACSDSFPENIRGVFMGLTLTIGCLFVMGCSHLLSSMQVEGSVWQAHVAILDYFGILLFVLCFCSLKPVQSTDKDMSHTQKTSSDFWPYFWKITTNTKIFLYGFLTIGTCSAVCTFSELWGPAFLSAKYQVSQAQSVHYNMFIWVGLILGAVLLPATFNTCKKALKGIRICGVILSVCFAILVYGPSNLPLWVLMLILFLLGYFSCADVLCFVLATQSATPKTSGLIVGWVNTINMFGLSILQYLVGFYLDKNWSGNVNELGLCIYQACDYEKGTSLVLNIVLICTLIACFMKTKNHVRQ